jgi:ornithine cyclodeaminase/alanine dehydrogenase
VDSIATVAEKSGDLLMAVSEGAVSVDDIRGELGQVVAGQVPGRTAEADITLFNSVGIGMQDVAIGRLLYDAAVEQGVGVRVDMAG